MYEDLYGFQSARSEGGEPSNGWAAYDGAGAAKVTMGLLGTMLLWELLVLVAKVSGVQMLRGPSAAGLSLMVTFGLFALTGIAFLTWFYRAYTATAAAENSNHPPNQAVWTFFVPILNLFRPYQIAAEIWRKTDQSGSSLGHSPLILGWWILWCLGRACPFWLSSALVSPSEMIEPPQMLFGLAELALTGSAIAVVRTLDGRIRALQGARSAPATF